MSLPTDASEDHAKTTQTSSSLLSLPSRSSKKLSTSETYKNTDTLTLKHGRLEDGPPMLDMLKTFIALFEDTLTL
jgi:hypothetical protein